MASRMSEDFEDGSTGDGTLIERSDLSASSRRHRPKGKRKVAEPAPAAMEDPRKERLQQWLIKNRRTAAASRERKQREMESLAVKVQALEVDNAGLKQALRHRNAEILALRAQMPQSETLAVALQMPQPAAPATSGWPPLRLGFPAWPPPWGHRRHDGQLGQEPVRALRSPMQLVGNFEVHVDTEPMRGSGGQLTSGFRPSHTWLPPHASSLGQPLTEQPREAIGGASLPSSLSSTEAGAAWLQQHHSLSASGLSPKARSGFIRGIDGQFLCLAPGASLSSQEPPMPVSPTPCPAGQLDVQLLRAWSSSCPGLPPAGPAVEWAGGPGGVAHPSGQLLRARSGSYPPQPQHMLAHVDRRFLASTLDTSFSLPLPDPGSFEQMDFDNLWAHLN
ncbi:g5210 [Coccomyxa elongata]